MFGSSEIWIDDNNLSPGATYELTTYHRLDATYEYYQIVEDCEPYCSWWGDKYGFSLIPTGGPPSEWDEYFNPSGPATPIETTSSIERDQYRRSMGDCYDLPYGEILYWLGAAYPDFSSDPQMIPVGVWGQEVEGSSSSYKDRLVREVNGGVTLSGDTCYWDGSEKRPITGFLDPWTWTVGQVNGQPAGENQYGGDFVGWNWEYFSYYASKNRAPCGVAMMQLMQMACGYNSWPQYKTHVLYWGVDIERAKSGKDQGRDGHVIAVP